MTMPIPTRFSVQDAAVVLVLVFFGMAGAIPGIAPNQANEMTGASATALQSIAGIGSQIVVDCILALLLFRNRVLFTRTTAVLRWPFLLAVWTALSVLWSQAPPLTARRAIPFALATGFGVLLALVFTQQRLLSLLNLALLLLACGSAVLAIGFPAIGLDASTGHGGDWQGVFTQKNACGRAMVFALTGVAASERLSAARVGAMLLFAAELLLSGSRGAWGIVVVLLLSLAVFRVSCRFDAKARSALFASSTVLLLSGTAIVALNFAALAPLLGRDATLTGRTAIWHEVWLAILRHPLLGYGFSAFWRGAQAPSWDVVVALRFVLFHAHNGFLEIWLELGAGGLLLFALSLLRGAFLLWPEMRAGNFAEAAWPFSILLLILLYDFDENTLLSFNGLFWVLYTAALARIEVLSAERRAVRTLLAPRLSSPAPHPWLAGALPRVASLPALPQTGLPHKPSAAALQGSPWL